MEEKKKMYDKQKKHKEWKKMYKEKKTDKS
jgi:hypothetical protein